MWDANFCMGAYKRQCSCCNRKWVPTFMDRVVILWGAYIIPILW